MFARGTLVGLSLWLALGVCVAGCTMDVASFLNPDLMSIVGGGTEVATLPGDAPGLLVSVENRTDRWIRMVVSFRDPEDEADAFTEYVQPGQKTGRMLDCPVSQITVGDTSDLDLSGARVYPIENRSNSVAALLSAPFIEVDPFGNLLRDDVNYDCGDSLLFTVEASSASQSGYRVFAYIRRSDAP